MLLNSHTWDPELNCFVSDEHRRVAMLINKYDNELFLCFIPPEKRELNEEYPFAVVHMPNGRPSYIVFKVKQDEVNADLLVRIWKNDTAKNGNILQDLELKERANRMMELAKLEDEKQDQLDFARSMLKSPLNWYRHGGKVYT